MKETIARTLDGKGEWGPWTVTLIIVLVIGSTCSFALSTVESLQENNEAIFSFVEAFSILAFTIEYLLRCWTSPDGVVAYMVQPIAIIDLCSVLPSWIDALIPGDQFPAFNFLRMLRIFKFLSASKRGEAGVKAFQDSWNDNKSLIYAACFAGGAVWLATASLLYLVERDNEDMIWCYPPAAEGESLPFMGSSHDISSHKSNAKYSHEEEEHSVSKVLHCSCDDDGCSGSDCLCQHRFKSIPSSMFFVLLSLAGEFPLADKYSQWGRVIAAFTAVMSVGIFAIPTGLVGAALEGAIGALNADDDKDYDVDDEDVAEIAAEANRMLATNEADTADTLVTPGYTTTPFYKKLTGWLILLSSVCAIFGTSSAVRKYLGEDSITCFILFYVVSVFLTAFFLIEWLVRVSTAGILPTMKSIFRFPPAVSMSLVDLMSWLPEFLWLVTSIFAVSTVIQSTGKADEDNSAIPSASHNPDSHHDHRLLGVHVPFDPNAFEPTIAEAPNMKYFPAYITLTTSLFRMMKFERYIHGFKILGRVLDKSQGVLMIGGMAATVMTIFASTLMYYAERNNPDPNTQKYYTSIPMAAWMTTLNMSGEAPLCDYTTAGSLVVGMLSIAATAIFAIPVGALGSGFEAVISEITTEQGEGEGGEENPLLPTTNTSSVVSFAADSAGGASVEMITKEGKGYGAIPTKDSNEAVSEVDALPKNDLTTLQRLVEGRGTTGEKFVLFSLLATLFAVTLEIFSTVDYSTLIPSDKDEAASAGFIANHLPSVDFVANAITLSEFGIVGWFTCEYVIRLMANGWDYVFSMYGVIDALSTFPYYLAHGLGGSTIAKTMDIYDGPMRAMRILRLVRLDAYVPSLTLIDDAVRNCWAGLSVALFAGGVIWFLFNECLYFAEWNDVEEGESKRFRNALSSLQYSAVLLSGDYPIVDFSLTGKLCCACAVIIAVGVVAVPASVLAGAFVSLLQEQAEERRKARFEAASKMQNIFLKNKSKNAKKAGTGEVMFAKAVKDAVKNSAVLRGLDSSLDQQPLGARLCIWKNNRLGAADSAIFGVTGVAYKKFMMKLVGWNILAVVLESIPEVQSMVPHFIWQGFEAISVLFFTLEYAFNILSARYDPRWNFSRWEYITSFVGMADYSSITPFYMQTLVLPFFFGNDPAYVIDATVFRILRLARIIELEQFFEAFTLLGDVFTKAGPVLKATGVLALILWVGGATAFYYADPHSDATAESMAAGGETPAVFTSIVDAMYYMSIFMAGEWCVVDFTPIGGFMCTIFAIVGVALFSIPVGVLFEGFQDMLEEKHASAEKKED